MREAIASDEPSQTILLRAILAVMLEQRARAPETAELSPPEVLLSQAGLDYRAIASLLGKKPDAVRMMLARRGRETK